MKPTTKVAILKRRLGVHRRRLRYWSGVPSLSGFGPSGRSLSRGHMDAQYELASVDAMSIAQSLDKQGVEVQIVDLRATFRLRYTSPKASAVLLWPISDQDQR